MTRNRQRIGLAMVIAVVAYAAVAAGCTSDAVATFPELDRNHDGRISEREAGRDSRVAQAFPGVDADRDGALSAFEYLQAIARR
jgi:hypothetical protein